MVLPLSAVSGSSWEAIRSRWQDQYEDIIVITIAGARDPESSFSAETDISECLFVARRSPIVHEKNPNSRARRASFVILDRQVRSSTEGDLLAKEVRRLVDANHVRRLEDSSAITRLRLGEEVLGVVVDALIPSSGPWPLAGISDGDLAKAAYHLERGKHCGLTAPRYPLVRCSRRETWRCCRARSRAP